MSKIDTSLSVHRECADLSDFTRSEKRMARILLRRLRYLEKQIRDSGGLGDGNASGAAAFVEWEADSLEWALTELGFIEEKP